MPASLDEHTLRAVFERTGRAMFALTPPTPLAEPATPAGPTPHASTIIHANAAAARLLAADPATLPGRDITELVLPAERESLTEALHAALGEASAHPGVVTGRWRSSETPERWIALEIIAESGLLIATADSDDRHRRLRSLTDAWFEDSADLNFTIDDAGLIVRINRTACDLLARTPAELVGTPLIDLIDPEQHARYAKWKSSRRAAGADNDLRSARFRMIASGGSMIWVEWRFHFHEADGLSLQSGRDITRSVEFERVRRAHEDLLRRFIEQAPSAIAMVDRDMRYILASRRWLRDYGLEGQAIIGRSHYEVFANIPNRWEGLHRRALNGERITCEEDAFVDNDGNTQWLRWEIGPWYEHAENIGGILMSSELITQQKQAELERVRYQWLLEERNRELEIARAQADAASRAKSSFLANMSHEIRTPMTAILGYSEVLMDERITADRRRQAINTIHRNGEHLLALIDDVLDLSKVEAGAIALEYRETPLRTLCDEVENMLRVRADAAHVDLEVAIEPDAQRTIRTDPLRLRQILVNLLTNAIKFTSIGGRVRLRAGLRRNGAVSEFLADPESTIATDDAETIAFDVIDDGIGISEEQQRSLFRPFAQADASTTRRFGGTGLGLALSRQLATAFNGTLRLIRSEPGNGSHFRLEIPLLPPLPSTQSHDEPSAGAHHRCDACTASDAAPLQPISLAGLARSGSPRILLVEDGPDNQRLFMYFLQSSGADVTLAPNGQLALDRFNHRADSPDERFPFDLILMDMQMPIVDGYQATQSLRMLGVRAPIIALTAHAVAGERDRCISAGCDDYLPKPITRHALLEACRQWLTQGPRAAAA
ncbi:MAG: PAS domain S-box protein [Phycisphaerales bacterium]